VRGQPVFTLSGLLQDLEKHLRSAAGAGPWQVRGGEGGRQAGGGSSGDGRQVAKKGGTSRWDGGQVDKE